MVVSMAPAPDCGHQRLGLLDVGRVAGGLRPGDRRHVVRLAAEQRIGDAEHRGVDDLLIGDRVSDGLADFLVVERRIHHVQFDAVHAVADRIGDHLELALLLHLGEILGRQIEGDVGVAALHQRAAVAGGGDGAPDDLLQFGQLAAATQPSKRS